MSKAKSKQLERKIRDVLDETDGRMPLVELVQRVDSSSGYSPDEIVETVERMERNDDSVHGVTLDGYWTVLTDGRGN